MPIVAIGASAGDTSALEVLLRRLPPTDVFSFVVAVDAVPGVTGAWFSRLSAASRMPVVQVEETQRLKPGVVHVVRLFRRPWIEKGRLGFRMSDRALSFPLNGLFQSVASAAGAASVGLILTGESSDGVAGLESIRAAGGMTLAPELRSVRDSFSARAAVDAGAADLVVSPSDMATWLAGTAARLKDGGVTPASLPDDEEESVLHPLARVTGLDFSLYRKSLIARAVGRRRLLTRCQDLGAYANRLREDPDEVRALSHDPVFYPRRRFFDETMTQFFRRSLALTPSGRMGAFRAWVPACSTGGEVYGLALALADAAAETGTEPAFQLFGTDVSDHALARARSGVFGADVAFDMPEERFRRAFIERGSGVELMSSLRHRCVFGRHDIGRAPSIPGMDLISVHTLFERLRPARWADIAPVLHFALRPGGALIGASGEGTAGLSRYFLPAEGHDGLWIRRPVAMPRFTAARSVRRPDPAVSGGRRSLSSDTISLLDEQRHRIGQDLHDGLGQHLTGMAFRAVALSRALRGATEREKLRAKELADLAEQAIARTRSIARGLHPVEAIPQGLMSALDELANRVRRLFSIECRFRCDRPVLLQDAERAKHLFRIAEEAVTNALRHSQADRVEISLRRSGADVVLSVTDNGAARDDDDRPSGLGQTIMRSRCALINGRLRTQPLKTGGTRVECRFQP